MFSDNNQTLLHAHNSVISFAGKSFFTNSYASKKETAAITSIRSEINIHHGGILTAQGNRGINGGTMLLIQSHLKVHGQCNFFDNYVSKNGGAIHAYESILRFEGIANFRDNSADENGGAISSVGSTIQQKSGTVSFKQNHAERGGAIYLSSVSRLHIIKATLECDIQAWYCISDREKWQALNFTNNSAKKGGAIYIDDIGANSCSSTSSANTFTNECLIQDIAAYKSASD